MTEKQLWDHFPEINSKTNFTHIYNETKEKLLRDYLAGKPIKTIYRYYQNDTTPRQQEERHHHQEYLTFVKSLREEERLTRMIKDTRDMDVDNCMQTTIAHLERQLQEIRQQRAHM